MTDPRSLQLKLITWSFKASHLYFDESVLCGRSPRDQSILFNLGSIHVSRLSFCKDCTLKLAELFETQQAFHRNVTRHPLKLLADGMLDGGLAT